MDSFLADLRHTLRSLGRDPGFTGAVLLILALGIGATSAIFSVVSGLLLSPLPFDRPDQLTRVVGTLPDQRSPLSYLDYTELRQRNTVFSDLAVHTVPRTLNLTTEGNPESLVAEMVSANFFETLGVHPILGRTFGLEEDLRWSAQRVAVISHSFWVRRFAQDPAVIGKEISINDQTYQLIGIMPEWFRGITDEAEAWLPITLAGEIYNKWYLEDRRLRWLACVGRLKGDVSLEQAQQSMTALGLTLQQEWPEAYHDQGIEVTSLREHLHGKLSAPLWMLQACSLLVLLVICSNVANLLLARALRRERDFAVRTALGVPRLRLVRQLLTESLTLALLGSLLGLLLAYLGVHVLRELGALQLQSYVEIRLDATVVIATILVALVCGLGFGLAPIFLSFRINLANTLKAGGRGGINAGRGRLRQGLVVAEVALAVILVIGAGLISKSFQKLSALELGFVPEQVMTMQMDLLGEAYVEETDRLRVARQYLDRLDSVSGIEAFALSSPGGAPTGELVGRFFTIEERIRSNPNEDTLMLPYHAVTPRYFETLGARILEGRDFTVQDSEGAVPVIVVSRSMAERFWPGESPLGKRVRTGFRDSEHSPWRTVVGVAADMAYEGRTRSPELDTPIHAYLPLLQVAPSSPPRMHVLARADGVPPEALIGPLRHALRDVAPTLPLKRFATLEGLLAEQSSRDRFLVLLMALFAVLALVLAVVGIYAVFAYTVQQQSREIGLRMALGASRPSVLGLLLGQALRMVVAGLGLGLLVALALGRYLESILFGVVPSDPLIFLFTVVLFLTVTLAAICIPVVAALRIDPAVTLQAG